MKNISLKIGARVMLVTNDKSPDKRYFNGKIGTIAEITLNELTIHFPEEAPLKLQRELWQQTDYRAGKNINQVEESILGELRQFPVRLAWAVTIHKSQGLTFDKAVIDAGRSFEAGQIYVALSRVRSLRGVILASRLTPEVITCNQQVIDFSQTATPVSLLTEKLPEERETYIKNRLVRIFEFSQLINSVRLIGNGIEKWKNTSYSMINDVLEQLITGLQEQADHTGRFRLQLLQLFQNPTDESRMKLQERVKAATGYYDKLFNNSYTQIISRQLSSANEKTPDDLINALKAVAGLLHAKIAEFNTAVNIAAGLAEGTQLTTLLKLTAKPFEQVSIPVIKLNNKVKNTKKEQSGINKSLQASLQLFQEGNTIAEIATVRNVSGATIQGHLAELVLLGMIDVSKFMIPQKLELIAASVASLGKDINAVKIALGPDYSFFEIRIVINHLQLHEGQS